MSKVLALDTSTSGTMTLRILSNLSQLSCDSATDLYLFISVIMISFHSFINNNIGFLYFFTRLSMKFFLTLYICSVVNQNCAEVPVKDHDYDRFYKTHYECVQKGLGESYSVLFDGEHFTSDVVNTAELYPKFMCEKVEETNVPEEPA